MALAVPSDDDYSECVQTSERVAWSIDDVLPASRELNFAIPFLPEALVHLSTAPIPDAHKLTLNHIRAHSYVNLFAFVEEYIIATALRHAHAEQFGSVPAMRALLRFADEELKHQQLFWRFRDAFARGFGHPCDVLDNAVEVAGYILTKPALSVMLTTLHLELITQQHYIDAIKSPPEATDLSFRSMFEHHWIEESQHARIDALEIAKLAALSSPEATADAVTEYEDILVNLDGLLLKQADMDRATLERATGHEMSADQRAALVRQQHNSYRQDFIHSGLSNVAFGRLMQRLIGDEGPRRLALIAGKFR
ncbi:MAG: hypothetical protein M4D80_09925 [Myxococcota bacterium]|nr:hypothetical protein [Deltaproteobacteria bacterium]MDQ3335471.1 hypothetical protein [Myxococcota bacterium]